MEVSEYLVGSPAFKAGDTGDPRMAGSIPVHLRQISPQARFGSGGGSAFGRGRNPSLAALDARRLAGGRVRPNRLRSFGLALFGVLILAMLLLMPGSVGAQGRLLESSPVDGASLADLDVITFEFDTLLRPEDAVIRVIRLDGTEVNVASVSASGSVVTARLAAQIPSGNYEISYSVVSSDGAVNEGAIRVSIDSPDQALSGGLLAVLAFACAMLAFVGFVFWQDKRRRPAH